MATSDPVLSEWNEARRLSGRNFQCQRCDQRWFEGDLVWQDGLYICLPNCYEENGGEIDRDLERAAGAKLAAELSVKESMPPKQAGWWDDRSITAISDLSPRKVTVIRAGGSQTMVLTGVGFAATDTITTAANITITPAFDSATQVTLTISAGASAAVGDHPIVYNSDTYPNSINVR